MTASPIVPRSLSASSIAAHSVRFHQSGTFFRLACPAHGDAGLSLAIWDLPEGGIGARCFTHGCSDHEIAQALGLPEPESARYQCPVEGCRSRADSLMAIYTHAEGFVGGVHRQGSLGSGPARRHRHRATWTYQCPANVATLLVVY